MQIVSNDKTKHQIDLDVVMENAEIKKLFNDELRKSVQKVKMKGFRPGKTPPGLLKRMYGTDMMVELINKQLITESEKYLREQGVDTYGYFVFSRQGEEDFRFDPDADQSFDCKLSFIRAFDPEEAMATIEGITYYLPETDTAEIDKHIDDLRNDHGTPEEQATVEGDSVIMTLHITPADDTAAEPIEVRQNLELIPGEELRSALQGKATGYSFETTAAQLSDNDSFINFAILNKLNKDAGEPDPAAGAENTESTTEPDEATPQFDKDTPLQATLSRIETIRPAEIDEAFFSKLDPYGNIKSREDIEEQIRHYIDNNYRPTANMLAFIELRDQLSRDFALETEEGFTGKYFTQHGQVDQHTLQHHQQQLQDDLSWYRIKEALDKEFGWEATEAEIRRLFAMEIQNYLGNQQFPDNLINQIIDSQMKNKQSVDEKGQTIYLAKVARTLVDDLKIPVERISKDEFENKIKALNEKLAAAHEHRHDLNHEHDHQHDHGHDHTHTHAQTEDITVDTQYENVNNITPEGEEG